MRLSVSYFVKILLKEWLFLLTRLPPKANDTFLTLLPSRYVSIPAERLLKPLRLSVRTDEIARQRLNGFSSTLGSSTNVCRHIPVLSKIGKQLRFCAPK